MTYQLEPLEINLPTQSGTYSVTVSINAHSTTEFSICEETAGYVTENCHINENENRDITFMVTVTNAILIKIYCDGNITATAMAEYAN